MDKTYKIAVIVGSLREGSLNRKLAQAIVALAPSTLSFEFVNIDMPLYNPDLDTDDRPASWTAFRDAVRPVDGVLFVTPEYNRSVPAGVKNAIDVGSRPMGASVWSGKPAGIVSGSPGAVGGFGANHALRQSLVFLNMPAMQQPEAYIGGLGNLFEEDGSVKDQSKGFIETIGAAFAAWVALHPQG
ncbi:ACP phosphodiesterase [Acuticoccus sediminis]|uniref:ACP phosphodiesterase n=1 Tax=Acuticoccus sediminis TaxID=2184697 RepID=A0A8B2P0N4_9HYPH|nr:NADPH-dependent FMN reductase [Acuticoccus sediminis]RAI02360.1 ACP phosphodiesterase [Acuticoccus sediminis]